MKRCFLFCLWILFSLFLHGNIYFKHLGKNEGLSQISVVSIAQDELGRMWLGTLEGLNCYDGNRMTVFNALKDSLIGNEVHDLVCDKKGNVFFTADGKLMRYALYEERFYDLKMKSSCLFADQEHVLTAVQDSIFQWNMTKKSFQFVCRVPSVGRISNLYMGADGGIWIGSVKGLYRMEELSGQSPVCILPKVTVYSLFQDSKGRLWVAGFRDGMYQLSPSSGKGWIVRRDLQLPSNDVRCFVEDDEGCIWAGTFNGLYKIDDTRVVSGYKKEIAPGALSHSSIFSLYKDLQGSIWVGTYYGGVNYFNPVYDIFQHYTDNLERDDCLSFAYVGNMVEDKRGDIWICTEGGGLNCLHRATGKFSYYLNDSSHPESFFPNLKCIEYNSAEDCLYIGTHKQGMLCFDIASKNIRKEESWGKMGASFSEIFLKGNSLYLLADNGLFVKSGKSGPLAYLFPDVKETHAGGTAFFIDSQENVWMALRDKLIRISLKDSSDKSVYLYGENGLGRFIVSKIVEDKSGNLYFGTSGSGIYRYNPSNDRFVPFSEIDLRYCYTLNVTPDGFLLASGEKGVFVYHLQTGEIKIVDAEKQLHLSAVNDGCGLLCTRDGEIFVGGTEGMSTFRLSRLFSPFPAYNLFFSALEVNNRQFSAAMEGSVLSKALPFLNKLELAYNQNNLQLTFSSNNYIESAKRNIYEYCLEGFDKNWNTAYSHNLVFTNLEPGHYKLVIREKEAGDENGQHTIELPIFIHRPWWNTWWAYLTYFFVLFVIAYELLRNWRTKLNLRHSLAQEKLEKEKNEELTQAKLQFFANISHEFRTPLTLIISQTEALLQSPSLSPYFRVRLQRIYRNTFQFRELISELLDFRKMERGKLTLHVCQLDVIAFLREMTEEFQNQAQVKNITFSFRADNEEACCWADRRQLRKVISNLLSNAFKYTPVGGKVELVAGVTEKGIEIKVIDSGEGIPEESLPFVFDRFYQADTKMSSPGSGIGLALAKGIVELHHGVISVKSVMGYGSIFTVLLPVENPFQEEDGVVYVEAEDAEETIPVQDMSELSGDSLASPAGETEEILDKQTILLVEDNEDMLQVLVDMLSPLYKVKIAMNGQEGLDKALEESPDLIISDVMMPVMSGTEMCMKLKTNFNSSHIPVILLTALTSDDSKLKGVQCGADDYVEKPFNHKILLGKIANILRSRKLLVQKFQIDKKEEVDSAGDIQALALNPMDVKFLSQLETVVKEHLADPEFDINALARQLGVSRSSLYNKLKVLSDMTPTEFMLNARLKYALDLLENHPDLQITEIAYQAGFNSLRYFRHCFKARFNQTPQEYREKKGSV